MPINVSAFVGHGETCTCYRCRVRREVAGFRRYLDALPSQFGGITPRNYDHRLNFNNPVDEGNPRVDPVQMSLEQVEQIKYNIKQCLDYNQGLLGEAAESSQKKYVHCWDCGKLHRSNPSYVLTDDRGVVHQVCGDCVRSRYRVCDSCHALKDRHQFTHVGDGYFCKTCFEQKYYRCNNCDAVYPLGDEHRFDFVNADNSTRPFVLCPNCKSHLQLCTGCGHHFFEHPERTRARRGLCQQCFNDRGQIRNYSYKPQPRFKSGNWSKKEARCEKLRNDKLMTGYELELENEGRIVSEEVCAALTEVMGEGFMYFKRDGSIHNGFELVTHPFSWQWYVQNRNKLETMMNRAYELGMRSQNNCGLHIHMTKRAFTSGHIYKFFKFMYDRKNRDFITRVSRRGGESHYASFAAEDEGRSVWCGKNKMNASHQRHSAVNANGGSTIEVRVFRSTHTALELFATIEFVYAAYEFTCNFGYNDMAYWNFLNWLSKRHVSNQYRNLVLWLRDHVGTNDKEKFRRRLKKNHVSLNLKKGE